MADCEEEATESRPKFGEGTTLTHEFVVPRREILNAAYLPRWEKSQAYNDYVGFVTMLSDSVKGKKSRDETPVSEATKKMVNMLETLDKWIDEIPPTNQPQRFGNKAYRTWFARLEENLESLVEPLLPDKFKGAVIEVGAYLKDGFGNKTRIDYGTGHEMYFVAFLCCLFKLRIFVDSDCTALVFKVFARYLELMRRLQMEYRLEPAGSQGVWGLDDFQFVPFIWGSAQLIDHPRISPKSFVQPDVAEAFSKDYMFLGCVKFIDTMKSGPFAEHSNTLWGISGVASWTKVNSGLMKMYKAEVLSKFPVIQHFVFGTLMSIEPADKFKKPLGDDPN